MAGKIRRIWEVLAACFEANKEPLTKSQVFAWVGNKYPDGEFTLSTLEAQLYRSCYNVSSVQKYNAPKILFYQKRNKTYSLRGSDYESLQPNLSETASAHARELDTAPAEELEQDAPTSTTFAIEAHLRDYLTRNLNILERGLELWSLSPPSVEYFVDGRSVDILAKDAFANPVVIELKLKKGYDRVVGQALLYQGLVAARLGVKKVRIMLVSNVVSDELKIACARLTDVMLFEYAIAMQVKQVNPLMSEEL